jgi:UDP-4-amino-4,6-dideoxy-N-acetyl-beta-L-altrosamine transaminase
MIPYGRQSLNDEDMAAVLEVLKSDFLTQGPAVPRFEAKLAQACGAADVVAANSATSSLHVAYKALGCGPGDIVWTSPITFVATANAAVMCGADVDFVDVESDTGCMSVDELSRRLEVARERGALPKIVAPVHFTGRPCDMAGIAALAEEYGFHVVEDAAHAVGADDDEEKIGACRHSDICVFSFHPVKIVTTAEGGAAATQNADLAERMRRLVSHGITRDAALMDGESEGPWYYQQLDLGFNYRITDMQAALGASQMDRLDTFIANRRRLAKRYSQRLAGLAMDLPPIDTPDRSAWHLYPVRLHDPDRRRGVFEELRSQGIGVQVHYIPVHLQPFYKARGFKPGDFPVAEAYYSRAISIPMYNDLSDEDQGTVIAVLERVVGRT